MMFPHTAEQAITPEINLFLCSGDTAMTVDRPTDLAGRMEGKMELEWYDEKTKLVSPVMPYLQSDFDWESDRPSHPRNTLIIGRDWKLKSLNQLILELPSDWSSSSDIEEEESSSEEALLKAVLEDDRTIHPPPSEQYTIIAEIESITEDKLASVPERNEALTENSADEPLDQADEESILSAALEALESDETSHFPPVKQYTIRARIKAVKRDKHSF